MPRPRKLLAVPCPTHGAGRCPNNNGCPERRTLAGLPPLRGTTGAERGRRARALRLLGAACKAVENIPPGDLSESLALLTAAVAVVRRRLGEQP